MAGAAVEILSVGDELVLGEIADTNAAHIAGRLSLMGLSVRRTGAVGDRMEELKRAIGEAISRNKLVVMTGGLGPTRDDITRQAVAEVAGVELEYHPEVVEAIAERFNRRLEDIRENNRRQAHIPAGSKLLPNPVGTAPGFLLEKNGCAVFALPGVPHEMRRMLAEYVEPYARERLSRAITVQRRIHVTGLGESEIDERLGELIEPGRNPLIGTKVADGVCTVRLLATGSTEEAARELATECEANILGRFEGHVLGVDEENLEQAVVSSLTSKGLTAALAESCTGGLIGARITSVPGASACFLESVVTYSNEAKTRRLGVPAELIAEHGAVSAPVAEAMARGVLEGSGADIAVAVTGIAGPGGGTFGKPVGTVYLGVASARGARSTLRKCYPPRDAVRRRATTYALYLLLEEAAELGAGD